MNKREPPTKEIARRTTYGLVAEGLKVLLVFLWPVIAPVLAIAAGYFERVPWMYAITAAAVTFGAGATGALRFSELRARITPLNKLGFTMIHFSADFDKDKKTGQLKAIKKAQIGFQLQNIAHFPISFVMDELQTSFEGRINPKPERTVRGAEVPPGALSIFRDTPIDLNGGFQLDKASYDGTLKFRIRYGYYGDEKFEIEKNVSMSLVLDKKTGQTQITFWDVIDTPGIR